MYGVLKRIRSPLVPADENETLPHRLEPPGQYPADDETESSILANKTGLMAWFVSNCGALSKRGDYAKELGRHIRLDVYGKCGNFTCLPHNSEECGAQVMSRYKFTFSAENELCPDYVTEKFYRPLVHGTVPVVYGGADYSAYAPPGSYIAAADFSSPKDLADYLLLLDRNDHLYLNYFRWRQEWQVVRPWPAGFCEICRKLNDPSEPTKSYANLSSWWFHNAPCKRSSSFLQTLLKSSSE